MKDIYEKVGKIVSEILLYCKSVESASKPVFLPDRVLLEFCDSNKNTRYFNLDYKLLSNLYDHKLDKKILEMVCDLNE